MIKKAEIIDKPLSGTYEEKIYGNLSDNWIWIKFTDENYYEWCGQFNGDFVKVDISEHLKITYVATIFGIYLINSENYELIKYIELMGINDTSLSPNGSYLVADGYDIYVLNNQELENQNLNNDFLLDDINFVEWKDQKLIIECLEMFSENSKIVAEYDENSKKVKILSRELPTLTEPIEKEMFLKRISAFLIDYFIITIIASPFLVLDILEINMENDILNLIIKNLFVIIILLGIFLKDIFDESGSIGKRIIGIKIKEFDYETIPKWKLILRNMTIIIWPIEVIVLLITKTKIIDGILNLEVVAIKKPTPIGKIIMEIIMINIYILTIMLIILIPKLLFG